MYVVLDFLDPGGLRRKVIAGTFVSPLSGLTSKSMIQYASRIITHCSCPTLAHQHQFILLYEDTLAAHNHTKGM